MASETLGIDEWLMAVLSGDATLTALLAAGAASIFAESAPANSLLPLVVFRSVDSQDVVGQNASRIMVTEQRLVEGICEGESYTPVKAIAERIDTLIHRKPDPASQTIGTWSGVTLLSSDRLRVSRLAEELEGRHYRRLGGIYNISAQ